MTQDLEAGKLNWNPRFNKCGFKCLIDWAGLKGQYVEADKAELSVSLQSIKTYWITEANIHFALVEIWVNIDLCLK